MRRNTLTIISSILSAIVAIVTYFSVSLSLEFWSIETPLSEILLYSATGISGLLFKYIFEKILFRAQKEILKFRKARGNDIQEQEKFETETGLISIMKNNDR